MKLILSVAALLLASTVFATPRQTSAAEPAQQASNDATRSTSGRATSHDRHARKHRAANHHHRHRTTTKNHNS
jgi:hypothetical protein